MPSSHITDQVREVMLESAYVDEVLTVAVDAEAKVVGVRFRLANVHELDALPPLFAQLRASIKSGIDTLDHVFLEPDVTERRLEAVPTENIVIRGWD